MPVITTLKNPLQVIRQKIRGETPIIRVKEQHFHFDPAILELPDNTYLEGYWQSEKYFKRIEEIIHQEFSFKNFPDPVNRDLGDRISSVNSVSIHVRRGDYVTNPVTNQTHGVCDIDYYQKAIVEIFKNVVKPHFFVFSDDQIWAKSHIITNAPTEYVTHNKSSKNYEDMHLMSLCHHHIIANSSFSWWGAWLSNYNEKMVIAPEKWLNDCRYNTDDICPKSWLMI
jgi:hypothetical protein